MAYFAGSTLEMLTALDALFLNERIQTRDKYVEK